MPLGSRTGDAPLRVLHVITGLSVGGAETMLAKLLEHGRGNPDIEQHVLSLVTPGAMLDRVSATGVSVHSLDLSRRAPNPFRVVRAIRLARTLRPQVIVGWMYHAHLIAWLLGAFTPGARVVWNVRHSLHDTRREKPATRLVLAIAAALSRRIDHIVYNSAAAMQQYNRHGYASARQSVIPNGFDCEAFKPDAAARACLVGRLGADPASTIVGMVARSHPMKDPLTLVEAVRRARERGVDLHLVLAGSGMDRPAPNLAASLRGLPADRVTILDHQPDVRPLLSGLDIFALPSAWGEGFPNVVAEAMACGTPCLVTDVGDSAAIVGPTGRHVPSSNVEAMADALLSLSSLTSVERAELAAAARLRIEGCFSIAAIAARYDQLYRQLCSSPARRVLFSATPVNQLV